MSESLIPNNSVALIIIYNHQYNKNIDIIEKLYKNRFSNIYHLVPFYRGIKDNVIPVYENSFYFHGYIAQGFKQYFEEKYNHYFFIADDLILNPIINEHNYTEHLHLDEDTSFISSLCTLDNIGNWSHILNAYCYNIRLNGIEIEKQLPTYNEALHLLEKFGLKIKPLHYRQIFQKSIIKYILNNLDRFNSLWLRKTYNLPYPLVGGYSDICVISKNAIKVFCHYSGVFSATQLFVEVAIPSAICLSANKIITDKDLILHGKPLWNQEDHKILNRFRMDINILLDDFPKDLLYIHPIKLSKWVK